LRWCLGGGKAVETYLRRKGGEALAIEKENRGKKEKKKSYWGAKKGAQRVLGKRKMVGEVARRGKKRKKSVQNIRGKEKEWGREKNADS